MTSTDESDLAIKLVRENPLFIDEFPINTSIYRG